MPNVVPISSALVSCFHCLSTLHDNRHTLSHTIMMIIDNPPCKTQKAHNKRFAHPPPLSYLWMRQSFLAKLRLLSSSFLFAHLRFFLDIKNGGCYANSVFYICESACIWSLRLSSSKILVCSPTHHPFKGDTFPLVPLWKAASVFHGFYNFGTERTLCAGW